MNMANDVGKAMSRLKHRDIRTRRRAVRTLFEANDPSTLKAFEVLLDDEDPWFVSKALDAYRLWAVDVGEAAVSTLLRHRSVDVRRAGANLLAAMGTQGMALSVDALQDNDIVVLKKAAGALMSVADSETALLLLRHDQEAIRILGLEHPLTDHNLIQEALSDQSLLVQRAALEQILTRNIEVELETLLPFMEAGIECVKLLIWASENAPTQMNAVAKQLDDHHLKELTDHLRVHALRSDDSLIACLIEAGITTPVARWVLRKGAEEDTLRWSLIENPSVPLIERSKLLERLIGRAHEPEVQERVEALLETTQEELLKVACENLSTAANEVSS